MKCSPRLQKKNESKNWTKCAHKHTNAWKQVIWYWFGLISNLSLFPHSFLVLSSLACDSMFVFASDINDVYIRVNRLVWQLFQQRNQTDTTYMCIYGRLCTYAFWKNTLACAIVPLQPLCISYIYLAFHLLLLIFYFFHCINTEGKNFRSKIIQIIVAVAIAIKLKTEKLLL